MPKSSFEDHLQNPEHNISLYLQPILAFHFMLRQCCGAGDSVMIPVLTEFLLSGRPAMAKHSTTQWRSCPRGDMYSQEEGRGLEKGPLTVRQTPRGAPGEQPHPCRPELLLALLTCCVSLPMLAGTKRRKGIRQLISRSCFALVCSDTVDSRKPEQ